MTEHPLLPQSPRPHPNAAPPATAAPTPADVDLRVPNEPTLIGVSYAFQALVLENAGNVRLTNRVVDRFLGQ